MERTLLAGDFLFVNKAVYGAQIPGTHARLPGFESPRRGDVIVFAYPKNPELNYVKRVIGAPGDTVEMRSGEVRVNGRRLVEPYVQRVDPRDVYDPEFNWQRDYLLGGSGVVRDYRPTRDTWGPLAVPAGKYFVLGDNPDNSADRSEEHTSELQSHSDLVCRLLLEKKKKKIRNKKASAAI